MIFVDAFNAFVNLWEPLGHPKPQTPGALMLANLHAREPDSYGTGIDTESTNIQGYFKNLNGSKLEVPTI